MEQITCKASDSTKPDKQILEKLREEQQKLKSILKLSGTKKRYPNHYSSINLAFDKELVKAIKKVVSEKQKLKIDSLVVIGIGGSNLGTIAIHEALNGLLYNEQNPHMKLYFADNIDPAYIVTLKKILKKQLLENKNILINVVTKSGTTTETIANFQVLLELLRKHHPNYLNFVVVTSDKNSPLDQWAKKENITRLNIPKFVGGRYSVFSPVGLFPLSMIGINIAKLLSGARKTVEDSLSKPVEKTVAGQTAIAIHRAYKKGLHIHNIFIFSQELTGLGYWYRQLVGESLGKTTIHDPQKRCNLTPTISIGCTDLHSVAQLYLGGLPPTFTTFISVQNWKVITKTPTNKNLKSVNAAIQGKSLNEIMTAIFNGTVSAYKKQKNPFVSCSIPLINPYYLASLLQTFMIQTIYLGKLFDVNPFDQPHVELYKKETRLILDQ